MILSVVKVLECTVSLMVEGTVKYFGRSEEAELCIGRTIL